MRKARVAGPVEAALFPRATQIREQTFEEGAAGGSRLQLSSETPNLMVGTDRAGCWTSACLSTGIFVNRLLKTCS